MSYNIKLEVFEGPLDLLLHLIKEHEVDIYDIPIARITEEYFEYINVMKALNLDIAGEFLVMASTLTYIKSRMLLPKHEQEDDDAEEGVDPREELVAKLIEYKKFKEAAHELKRREFEQSRVFTRTPPETDMPGDGDLLKEVNVFELVKSFKRVLDNYGGPQELSVSLEEISVTDKLNEIMERIETVDYLTFDALFETGRTRMEVVATFLALLELMRLKLLKVSQTRLGGEILIYRAVDDTGDSRSDGLDEQEPEPEPESQYVAGDEARGTDAASQDAEPGQEPGGAETENGETINGS